MTFISDYGQGSFKSSFSRSQSSEPSDMVELLLTREEAWELLARCASSSDADTTSSQSALMKLAKATENHH